MARSPVDIGIKKNKGKGEISFSFTDIFNDFVIKQKINSKGFTVV